MHLNFRTGRIQRGLRYLDKALDESQGRLRAMQLDGKNVILKLTIMLIISDNKVSSPGFLFLGYPICFNSAYGPVQYLSTWMS